MSTKHQTTAKLPAWLPLANRFVMWLQRRGVRTGTIHVLSAPGRNSGEMRTTPVSPLTVDDIQYVIAGHHDSDWAHNARAAGWGHLAYGDDRRRVRLTELERDDREPILRAFPTEVPHGVAFFTRLYGVSADPDEFATLVDHTRVFRIEPMDEPT